MSKIVEDYATLGIIPGAKVDGLVAQSLLTVYAPMGGGPEVIESVTEYPDDSDMVVVKTKELSARTTIFTARGELPLPVEQRQYVVAGTDALRVVAPVNFETLKGIDIESKAPIDIKLSEAGIDTDFSTLPVNFVKALVPFINYVNANARELNDIMDVSSLRFFADGVAYDMPVLSSLAKIE